VVIYYTFQACFGVTGGGCVHAHYTQKANRLFLSYYDNLDATSGVPSEKINSLQLYNGKSKKE